MQAIETQENEAMNNRNGTISIYVDAETRRAIEEYAKRARRRSKSSATRAMLRYAIANISNVEAVK